MTPVTVFRGQFVTVFGLGGSGFVTAQALVAGGARVNVWDDNEHAREKARAAGLRIENLASADWRSFGALILSPGVPLTHPAPHWTVLKARAAGIEVIGDIELYCRERRKIAPSSPFVATTGTNGKSTTTALVAHLFSTFGFDVQVGGNIGTPILALSPPDQNRVHVIECSSYQIDLAPSLDPSVGILLNVTPDHLDRHGTMENYAAIKARLVRAADLAVIGVDDAFTRAIAAELRAAGRNLVEVSAAGKALEDGIVYEGGRLYRRAGGRSALIADLAGILSHPRCAARTTDKTPLPPSPRWGRLARTARASRRGSPPFPGWRTGSKKSGALARCCSSMIPRRPTPTRPRRRCSHSKTSSGFWAAGRNRVASNRCGPCSTGSSRPI